MTHRASTKTKTIIIVGILISFIIIALTISYLSQPTGVQNDPQSQKIKQSNPTYKGDVIEPDKNGKCPNPVDKLSAATVNAYSYDYYLSSDNKRHYQIRYKEELEVK